jgi:hypothetical protein
VTTIAWDGKSIAADTQMESSGWIVPAKGKKLRKLSPGVVAAIVGDYEKFEPFLHWFERKEIFGDPFDLGEDARVIVATAAPCVTVYEGKGWFRLAAPFLAWGSGWPAAVAAMHMGADARRAVEIAAMVDPSTSSDVEEIILT